MKKIILGFIAFTVLILTLALSKVYMQHKSFNEEQKEFFTNFNIEFSGIIYNKYILDNEINVGVACVDIANNFLESYKEETKKGNYFVFIKNGRANIFMSLEDVEFGDSISVNINKNKKIQIYRNEFLIRESELIIPVPNSKKILKAAKAIECK